MTTPLDFAALARELVTKLVGHPSAFRREMIETALTQSHAAGRAEGLEEALKATADPECCWDMSDASLWTARRIGDRIASIASSDPAPRDTQGITGDPATPSRAGGSAVEPKTSRSLRERGR